ncbi:unnamed protein product [Ectocarpus sp. 6 AP-2014]
MGSSDVVCRFGSRAVLATRESVVGMTADDVHFVCCDVCHAVCMQTGVKGSNMSDTALLPPSDPRAKLLCQITDSPANESWSRPMQTRARVVGIVNVHSASKMSEVGCTCFHCGAGPM